MFDVGVNWGSFEGQNAIGIAGVARLYDNVYANGGIGIGLNQNTVGGRAGLHYCW